MTGITTRFAPSPTGAMHLGNMRTALLNWLFARKMGGNFLLRFEDTDGQRSQAAFCQGITDDLTWLGLNWDGEPLYQSARQPDHTAALNKLAALGLAYRCYCPESQLALDRKIAASQGKPPRYAGRCRVRGTTPTDAPFVWRLAVHGGDGVVEVADLLRGTISFRRSDLDDPVVARSDGTLTFLLPNAIDDALDGISHVLRGDDHLTNTAYQVFLLQALGLTPPCYLHHGLLLDAGGAKLSKRSGSFSLADLRQADIEPQAVIQTMVRLGHPNLPDQLLSLDELVSHFQPEHLSAASAHWQEDVLQRWNRVVLHHLPVDELAGKLTTHLARHISPEFAALVQPNLSALADAGHFLRLLDLAVLPDGESQALLTESGRSFFEQALACWSQASDWPAFVAALRSATGVSGKKLFLTLRAALMGCLHGPDLSLTATFLGRDGISARFADILTRI